jgi:hypothetical protein
VRDSKVELGDERARMQRGSVDVRNRLRELLQRFSEEEEGVPSMRYISPNLVKI